MIPRQVKSFSIGAAISPILFFLLYVPGINSVAIVILTILSIVILDPLDSFFNYSLIGTNDILVIPSTGGFVVLGIVFGLIGTVIGFIWSRLHKNSMAL